MRHVRHVSEAVFTVRLPFLGGVFGNAREIDTFDHRGVRHGFWWPKFFFVVVCLAVLTALVPLHRETLTLTNNLCETLYSKTNARMKYWSTIAKTIHCWHDRQQAVYTEWVQVFGVVEADTYAKKCGRISKEARQERQNHVKQLFFFSNAQCATHLGVVSPTCFERPACNLC